MAKLRQYCILLTLLYTSNAQLNFPRIPFLHPRHHLNRRVEPIIENGNPEDRISNEPRFNLIAPDLLRADSQENIYLEATGMSAPIRAIITVHDFSRRTRLLLESVQLDESNAYHLLQPIQISSEFLGREDTRNKFVYLKVNFEGYKEVERVLMVNFHSGYIFIQTDKPVYNPGDTVYCRAFVSSTSFKATDSSITVEFQNPEGFVIKQTSNSRAIDGVLADTLQLSDLVSEGMWRVTAKFDHWEQNTFSYDFRVMHYVLPAFNVTLTPKKTSLNLDDTELVVEISASYLYGEAVEGTAYVVFGIELNKEKRRLPSAVKQVNMTDGVVKLSMDEIKKAYPNIRELVGSSVYVRASVLTKSGSDLVEAERTGIKIVQSPYVIHFRDTHMYYKPGMPFDLTIEVSHHDGSPAKNVQVRLSFQDTPLTIASGSLRTTINMPVATGTVTITAETADGGLRPEQQARHETRVAPYRPFSHSHQNYLYISASSGAVTVGEHVTLGLIIKAADQTYRKLITHITYLVLNKGKIITAERLDVRNQLTTSVGLTITTEMMPSFRIVAFYTIPWTWSVEVVADSIWLDVTDTCIGRLTVGPPDGVPRDYRPGKALRFRVRGDPGAKVHMVAVDNAVYLLNKQQLKQRKIWDVVENGDIGCTHGGGRDSMHVFTDAGLLFASSSGVFTTTRKGLRCPGSARSRRSAEKISQRAQLESHYKEKLLQRCCKDGLRDIPMPYSCTRRSLYVTEGLECMRAFRYCCAHYRDQEFDTMMPTTMPPFTTTPIPTTSPTPRPTYAYFIPVMYNRDIMPYGGSGGISFVSTVDHSGTSLHHLWLQSAQVRPSAVAINKVETQAKEKEDEGEYLDETQVSLRFRFYESWLWRHVRLPSVADNRDGSASLAVDSILPDSITEWGILAVSASPDKGFCVAEPYNIKAFKPFFVDLKLPYSVARNEQVVIKAVLHNNGEEDLHVRVVLMKTEAMCSVAFNERHTQDVDLPARSSLVLPYTIMPLATGELPLEVLASSRDMGADRIQKMLRVVVDGVQKTEVRSYVLNPSAGGGAQVIQVDTVKLESVVPNSVPETFFNLRGNVLADSIENSISENSLAALIQMPGGCVEQNLASITLPLIATLYLDRADSWESVGVHRKTEALGYIKKGYEKQLAYRKRDGSYPPYRNQGTSTWITAFVVKVFSMAHSIIGVDKKQVCGALLYLLKHKQAPDGTFREDNPVYLTTMTGGLQGDEGKVTLTAFVLIALAEAKQAGIKCNGGAKVNVEAAIVKTENYLKMKMNNELVRPYTVAIVSYALSLMGKPFDFKPALLRAASPEKTHWPDSDNDLFTLEATGYALLALVKAGHMEEAKAPFDWLNKWRRQGGGYGSTQPTMVVLQGLSEYLVERPPPQDLSLAVDIKVPGRRDLSYYFDPTTSYIARSSKVPLDQAFEVRAEGNGQGILEVVTYYNQLHEVHEKSLCKDFELNITIQESNEKHPPDVEKSYEITINVRALGPRDVRMVILDISLPTGFTPENADLEMLSKSVDAYISNFKMVDNLSDRGSLILHLFKVSHKEAEILTFRLHQNFKVGLLQPSSVTVYEYYNPDHRCSRVYTPPEDKETLSQICQDNVCRCTQGDCCIAKKDNQNFPSGTRETFACKTLHHVYQVRVLNITQSYYDQYEVEITQVIKLGLEPAVIVGNRRVFMSNGGCREALNLQLGHQYLIIGPKQDIWNAESASNRFIYMFGKNTWVERWPSSVECSNDASLQPKCTALHAAAFDLSVNACRV